MKHAPQPAFLKLLEYCQAEDWAGYDPYDALNSAFLKVIPLPRLPRIALTQFLRRSPANLRRLLLIPKTQNPKAIGLFLSALATLPELSNLREEQAGQLVDHLTERLMALRSPGSPYWCWGYSFPWQTRTLLVPAGAPNLVATVFAAGALLDVYERRQDKQTLSVALSAAEYLLNELYWTEGAVASFSYPSPAFRSRTHNANFLASALLCRVARYTGEARFLAPALEAARYSASRQNRDGSWYYGEAQSQRWIDNFHTGYNLCALQSVSRDACTDEFDSAMDRGLEFYRSHFFRADGAPRYFHNRTYPIDIHCVAQSIITLLAFGNRESTQLARSVFDWVMDHMWDERGFFYYRVLRSCTIRASYMRWSQAWMLLAISRLLAAQASARAGGHPEAVEARFA
ncbi:MAG: hypothetical protein ACRD1N_01515 [Terriglobia bacterium]